MNKFIVAPLALILIGAAFYWNWKQSNIIREQQKMIEALRSPVNAPAPPSTPDIALQEKCAKQAEQAFKQQAFQRKDSATFTNHYNQKLNKCFVEMYWEDVVGDTIWRYKVLSDAYEGKTYGEYSWHTEKDKKYWEVPPFTCFMYPDGKEVSLQTCDSEAQFDDFVRQYMEN